MRLHTALHLANAVLLALLIGMAALHYDQLPERIPIHFDVTGEPDGWVAKSPLSVLLLPLIASATAALLYACLSLPRRYPHLVNIPGVTFSTLSEEAQYGVAHTFQTFLLGLTTALLLLFLLIQWGMLHAIRAGHMPGFVLPVVLAFVVASVLATPVLLFRIWQHTKA